MTYYYLVDTITNTYNKYDDWWKLIERLYYDGDIEQKLANNYNDEYHYRDFGFTEIKSKKRNMIVFDQDWRIVHTDFIYDSLRKFNPDYDKWNKREERYKKYQYKKIRNWRPGYRYNIRKNKNYCASLEEYKDLFPGDGKLRERIKFAQIWNDDLDLRSTHRSWKSQSKKKKQWM